MKKAIFFSLILLVAPVAAFAGEIFGTIIKDKQPMAKQKINIYTLGAEPKIVASSETDANGYFSVKLAQTGQFSLVLVGGEHDGMKINVSSNNSPTVYDLILIKDAGKWELRKQ